METDRPTLPSGWSRMSLVDVISRDGLFVDGDWVETKDQDPHGEVRLTQLADVGDGEWRDRSVRFLTTQKAEQLGCTYLTAGDILVARMPAPLGRACIFPGSDRPCITVVDVCVIRPPAARVNPRWLMWALNAPQARQQISDLERGTTRRRISRKNLATIQLVVPPRDEQDRIVDAIEAELSRRDAACAGLRSLKSQHERLYDALVTQAVTGSLLPQDEAEGTGSSLLAASLDSARTSAGMADPELDGMPPIPTSWRWATLACLGDVVGGVTKDAKREANPSNVTVPYLRVANVQRGWLNLRDVSAIRVPREQAEALRLQAGDILMNEGGDRDKLGRGWVWDGSVPDCIHQNHVFRVRLRHPGMEPRFVSWFANTVAAPWFERTGKQTTNLASISLNSLKRLPIPVPPAGEQRRIVLELERQLSIVSASQTSLATYLAKAGVLKNAILAAALDGAFTGTSRGPSSDGGSEAVS